MCSLFLIVYLMKTSLWLRSLVPPSPLPGLPPWLFVPTQRGKWPAALLFENCPAVKVAVTFSQCFPGLISSVPSPPVSLADSSPPTRTAAASGTTNKSANRLPLFYLFYPTISFIPPPHIHTAQSKPDQICATSPASLRNKPFPRVFGKFLLFFLHISV